VKKIAVILNTSEIGGAERSILIQASMMKEVLVDYYVPMLHSSTHPIIKFIKDNYKFNKIKKFNLSRHYYEASRSSSLSIIKALFGVVTVFQNLLLFKSHKYSLIWLNGNKVSYPFVVLLFLKNYKGRILWHLRDYPSSHVKIISFFIKRLDIVFVANSSSVNQSLKQILPKIKSQTIYNPTVEVANDKVSKSIETIGVVAMLTPWKGVHQVIKMVNRFENELKSLGIKKVCIYGDAIYKTNNNDQNYKKELIDLAKTDLIKFMGMTPFKDIYSEIDLLIHSSIKEEPFGRVIAESFKNKIPVISTCLGGSGELAKNEITALKYKSDDIQGLFESVERLCKDNEIKETLIRNAFDFILEVNSKIDKEINTLI
jgi:glycosyltransferase involved in cell wall biosynthesis